MGRGSAGGARPNLIRVEVNAQGALQRLGVVQREAGNRRVPNRQLATQLYGWVQRNFQASGGLQNPAWRPLAASTLKQKQRQGYSSQPLLRSGHLRQSFLQFYDNERAGVGSEVPYSQYHETGTNRLPQRAMLPPEPVALDFAVRIYNHWVASLARRA